VLSAIRVAARDPEAAGHDAARRIVEREHFRVAYRRQPDDIGARALATRAIAEATAKKFSGESVRYGASPRRGDPPDFPVLDDGSSVSSLSLSEVLTKLPASRNEYVFVEPSIRKEARSWIAGNREEIIDAALTEQAVKEKEEEVST
jgi:uncharacterized protein